MIIIIVVVVAVVVVVAIIIHSNKPWLRTSGVNTDGGAAKV